MRLVADSDTGAELKAHVDNSAEEFETSTVETQRTWLPSGCSSRVRKRHTVAAIFRQRKQQQQQQPITFIISFVVPDDGKINTKSVTNHTSPPVHCEVSCTFFFAEDSALIESDVLTLIKTFCSPDF